jgi:enamine deaminase RidA (YjgF/YER057c/UK114 family)
LTIDDTNLRYFNPPELALTLGYMHVVEASGGRTIYVSGQIALDRSGEIVGEGDLEAQNRQVFKNLKAALAAAGADFGDVVKLGYYLTDISQIGTVRRVRDEHVDTHNPPASTAAEVRRLFREELLIEVEAVAATHS